MTHPASPERPMSEQECYEVARYVGMPSEYMRRFLGVLNILGATVRLEPPALSESTGEPAKEVA